MGAQCSCDKAPAEGTRNWIVLGAAAVRPSHAAKDACKDACEPSGSGSPAQAKLGSAIKAKFRTRKEAWRELDVSNDARIDQMEFQRFLLDDIGIHDMQLIKQVFCELDTDHDGVVSACEFKTLFDQDREESPLVKQVKSGVSHLFSTWLEAFQAINISKSGFISKQELRNFMVKELQLSSPQATLDILRELDNDRDGKISQEEFQACFQFLWDSSDNPEPAFVPPNSSKKKGLEHFRAFMKTRFAGAKAAFNHLDKDNDRALDKEEMRRVLLDLGYSGDPDAVFRGLDADNDGLVTREEFKYQLKLVMRTSRATETCAAAGA